MKPWKIQKFFGDVVYDLRSRGLLPVAVLLLAGMVAVPVFLASSGSESVPPPATAEQTAAELAPENQVAVLAYDPGVRDYKDRLKTQASKDPFIQQFTQPTASTTALEQTGLDTDLGGGSGGDTTGGGGSGGNGGSTTTTTKGGIRYFRYEADIETGEVGGEQKTYKNVNTFKTLPRDEAPVMVYVGTNFDKRAAFLISTQVLSVEGAGQCLPSPDSCQMLVLDQGESAEMVWGVDGKTYRVKVLKVNLKVTKKLPQK